MAFLGPLTLRTREVAHLALTKHTYKMYPYVSSADPLFTQKFQYRNDKGGPIVHCVVHSQASYRWVDTMVRI